MQHGGSVGCHCKADQHQQPASSAHLPRQAVQRGHDRQRQLPLAVRRSVHHLGELERLVVVEPLQAGRPRRWGGRAGRWADGCREAAGLDLAAGIPKLPLNPTPAHPPQPPFPPTPPHEAREGAPCRPVHPHPRPAPAQSPPEDPHPAGKGVAKHSAVQVAVSTAAQPPPLQPATHHLRTHTHAHTQRRPPIVKGRKRTRPQHHITTYCLDESMPSGLTRMLSA